MIDRNLGVLMIPLRDRVLAADAPQATPRSQITPERLIPHPGASRGEAPAESIDESGGATNPDAAPARAGGLVR